MREARRGRREKAGASMDLPPAEAFGSGATDQFRQFLSNTRH